MDIRHAFAASREREPYAKASIDSAMTGKERPQYFHEVARERRRTAMALIDRFPGMPLRNYETMLRVFREFCARPQLATR